MCEEIQFGEVDWKLMVEWKVIEDGEEDWLTVVELVNWWFQRRQVRLSLLSGQFERQRSFQPDR